MADIYLNRFVGDGLVFKAKRPGLAHPMMVPAEFKKQNSPNAPVVPIVEAPVGKNLVGKTQYAIFVGKNRPGLARPTIVAKQDVVNKVDKR